MILQRALHNLECEASQLADEADSGRADRDAAARAAAAATALLEKEEARRAGMRDAAAQTTVAVPVTLNSRVLAPGGDRAGEGARGEVLIALERQVSKLR